MPLASQPPTSERGAAANDRAPQTATLRPGPPDTLWLARRYKHWAVMSGHPKTSSDVKQPFVRSRKPAFEGKAHFHRIRSEAMLAAG